MAFEDVTPSRGTRLLEAFKELQRAGMGYHSVDNLRTSEFYMLHAIMRGIQCQKREHPDAAIPPGVTVSALSRATHNSMPAASQILRGMEEKGIIQRVTAKTDRRRVYVCLTKQGEQLIQKVGNAFFRFLDDVTNRMGEQDTEELIRLLSKLHSILMEAKREQKMD